MSDADRIEEAFDMMGLACKRIALQQSTEEARRTGKPVDDGYGRRIYPPTYDAGQTDPKIQQLFDQQQTLILELERLVPESLQLNKEMNEILRKGDGGE